MIADTSTVVIGADSSYSESVNKSLSSGVVTAVVQE